MWVHGDGTMSQSPAAVSKLRNGPHETVLELETHPCDITESLNGQSNARLLVMFSVSSRSLENWG